MLHEINVFQIWSYNSDSGMSKAGSGSEAEDFEETYEVEAIRDKKRGDDDEWLYYVKWLGWDSDDNTWEPRAHVEDVKEILEEFERKWKKRQDDKHKRRMEKVEKQKKRRERELKAAARYKMHSYDVDSSGEEKRKKKKKREREKDRERVVIEEKPEEERKGKPEFFRDILPEKILGVTTDPGELYFYIEWEGNKVEPGLIKAKEAYNKIPFMCLKFYEKYLIWDKAAVARNKDSNTEQKLEGSSENNNKEASAIKEALGEVESKKDELDNDFPVPVPADA